MKLPRIQGPATWASVMIIIGIPVLLGMVAWLVFILQDPQKWCGVQVSDTKIAIQPIRDCTAIVLELIKWLGLSCLALIACAAVAFLAVTFTDRNADVDVEGPMGTGVKIGGRGSQSQPPAVAAADQVAGAAARAASDIKENRNA